MLTVRAHTLTNWSDCLESVLPRLCMSETSLCSADRCRLHFVIYCDLNLPYSECISDGVLSICFPVWQDVNATETRHSFCCVIESLQAPGSGLKPQPPSTHQYLTTIIHKKPLSVLKTLLQSGLALDVRVIFSVLAQLKCLLSFHEARAQS